MARQDIVRALVHRDDLDPLRDHLERGLEVDDDQIEVEDAGPGLYRDEQPDLELHALVRAGRVRVAVGAVLGAVVGVLVAVAVPVLREWLPYSGLVLGIGGAVGAAAVMAARGVQVRRDAGPRPEKLHEVGAHDAGRLVVLTLRGLRDRPGVVDDLMDRGVVLLDTSHPRVGRHERGARPAAGDDDAAGPSEP